MMTLTDRNQSSTADGAGARMTQAWQWLCEQRAAAPEGAEVWDLRFRQDNDAAWLRELTSRVLRGGYRLSPMQLYGTGPDRRAVWGAQDALVLKWVALSLQPLLPLHPACEHVKGHGGGKPSVTTLSALLMQKKTDGRAYPWVCRTDIRGYDRNISKQTLSAQVRRHVTCPVLRDLVDQYLHYTVEDGGTFHTPDKGISRGCPLSPLMGALHLTDMDAHFAGQKTIHYARYMDDIIILAKSRWQLRKYTRQLKQWFSEYGFEAQPDKTFTGRTEKGFDWMGAWLTHEGVTDIAPRAKANHREKVRRLYERLARVPLWARKREAQRIHAKVSTYRKRWTIWAGALLAVSTCAMADGPVVVLTSGNVRGDTGARFPVNLNQAVTVSGHYSSGNQWDFGGICFSHSASACNNDNIYKAWVSDGLYGFRVAQATGSYAWASKIILVPYGTAHLTLTDTGGYLQARDLVGSVDLGTGAATTQDGRRYAACAPLHDNSLNRGAVYTLGISSTCPRTQSTTYGPYTTEYAGTLTYNGGLAVYADGPLQAGKGAMPPVKFGLHTAKDFTVSVPLPNQIIVSGLNCNLQAVNGAVFDLGSRSTGAPGLATTQQTDLTVQCGGTNDSDHNAQISTSIQFSPGPGMDPSSSGSYKLTATGQPGFYGTIGRVGQTGCDKGLTLGDPDPTPVHIYHPGDTGQTDTAHYVFSLCRTGKPQDTGDYNMTLTATLVNV